MPCFAPDADLQLHAERRGAHRLLNRSDEAHSARISLLEALRGEYQTALTTTDGGYRVQQDATALLVEVPEWSGLVLWRGDVY